MIAVSADLVRAIDPDGMEENWSQEPRYDSVEFLSEEIPGRAPGWNRLKAGNKCWAGQAEGLHVRPGSRFSC